MFVSIARVFLVASLAASALAAPDALSPTHTSGNGLLGRSNPVNIVARSLTMSPAAHLTNAQRLSRGLPPNRPRSHHARRAIRPRQSSTCVQRTGTISVNIPGMDSGVGYLSRVVNSFGEYEFTNDPTQALSVSIPQCQTESTFFDILALNGLADFPFVGGVVGFASSDNDLGFNTNYVYFAGTSQVPRGPAVAGPNAFSTAAAIPVNIESDIWQINASQNNLLLPSWVNTDGSTPAIAIAYVPSTQAFALTGDLNAFQNTYGQAFLATFNFVPS